MAGETLSGSEGEPTPSLLETNGGDMVTIDGITMPLIAWFGFCPRPHEELDPEKIEYAAREFLNGRNPFAKKRPE